MLLSVAMELWLSHPQFVDRWGYFSVQDLATAVRLLQHVRIETQAFRVSC